VELFLPAQIPIVGGYGAGTYLVDVVIFHFAVHFSPAVS
jgi:hypothetical protein